MFADLPKAVDKFHFPRHKKTDKYCQESCNPNKVLKDLEIEKLNSPACVKIHIKDADYIYH